MAARAEPFLAIQKQSEESRFKEEREHAFHRECLPDDSSGKAREVRPVRAELEFHRDSSHHSENKIDSEDPRPEAGGPVIGLVVASQSDRLQHHNQWRQPHGQLRKKIMKGDGECEVKAVNKKSTIHAKSSATDLG